MQSYMIFGYGLKLNDLPEELANTLSGQEGFYGYFEDFDTESGIYYLIYDSPFSNNRKDDFILTSWSTNLESISSFKEQNQNKIKDKLKEEGLLEYEKYVDFYISSTSM